VPCESNICFITLYTHFLNFKSVDEISHCVHSTWTCFSILKWKKEIYIVHIWTFRTGTIFIFYPTVQNNAVLKRWFLTCQAEVQELFKGWLLKSWSSDYISLYNRLFTIPISLHLFSPIQHFFMQCSLHSSFF